MPDPATERYAAAPAPVLLRRVQSFLNTRSTGRPPEADLLAGPASANSWLRTLEWPARPRLTTDDLPPLYELRAALQAQLEADRAEGPRDAKAVFAEVALGEELAEFLTLPAYERLE